jgi:hypothetical protein
MTELNNQRAGEYEHPHVRRHISPPNHRTIPPEPSLWAMRVSIGGFYLVMAGINIGILEADSGTYRHFADSGLFPFVRHQWQDIVMAAPGVWIGLLAAGEILIGAALVAGGRWTLVGYTAIVAFHVALVLFGWGVLMWSVPVLLLMAVAIRRELVARRGSNDLALA